MNISGNANFVSKNTSHLEFTRPEPPKRTHSKSKHLEMTTRLCLAVYLLSSHHEWFAITDKFTTLNTEFADQHLRINGKVLETSFKIFRIAYQSFECYWTWDGWLCIQLRTHHKPHQVQLNAGSLSSQIKWKLHLKQLNFNLPHSRKKPLKCTLISFVTHPPKLPRRYCSTTALESNPKAQFLLSARVLHKINLIFVCNDNRMSLNHRQESGKWMNAKW